MNGTIGVIVAAAKGVIRTMLCDENLKAQVVPVDWAIAGLIMFAYSVGTQHSRPKEMSVICINTHKEYQKTWGEALSKGRSIALAHPFEAGLWYPNGSLTTNQLLHGFRLFFFQWIPAYFIDFLLFCLGKPRL